MANSTVTVPTVTIQGSQGAAEAEILTPQALEFLGALSSNFEAERQRLLAARVTGEKRCAKDNSTISCRKRHRFAG